MSRAYLENRGLVASQNIVENRSGIASRVIKENHGTIANHGRGETRFCVVSRLIIENRTTHVYRDGSREPSEVCEPKMYREPYTHSEPVDIRDPMLDSCVEDGK